MEQVISGDIVQSTYCLCISIVGQHTPDDKVHHDTTHLAQELGDSHELPGFVGFLNHRMLAVGFQRRPGCGPHKVRPTDARVPEITKTGGNLLPHLFQDTVVPTWSGTLWPLLTDEPDGR